MAANIGEAVGLSTILPSDQGKAFSSIIQRNQDQDAARKAREAKQKELASLDDFNVNYDQWLPMYGNEAAKIHKDLVNKFDRYQRENPTTAKNRIQLDAVEAKRRIGELRASNDEGKKYLAQGGGFYTEDEVAKTLINPKGSIADLNNLSKYKTKGVLADGTGVFSFVPVKKAGVEVQFGANDYNDIPIDKSKLPADYLSQMHGAPIPAGSERFYSVKMPTPQAIEAQVNKNLTKYDVAEDALYRVPDEIKFTGDKAKIDEAKRAIVRQDVLSQITPGGYDFRDNQKPISTTFGAGNLNDRIAINRDTNVEYPNLSYKPVAEQAKQISSGSTGVVPKQRFKNVAEFQWVDRIDLIDPADNRERLMSIKNGIDEYYDPIKGSLKGAIEGVGYGTVAGKTGYWAIVKIPEKKDATITVKESTTGGGTTTSTSTSIPDYENAKTVFVPYDELKATIKNYTTPKKAGKSYELDSDALKSPQNVTKEQKTGATTPTPQSNLDDEIINSTLDFENKKGYNNFGFTSYSGTLNKQQALEKAKKEYLPMVKDLPPPLRAVAFDFAFNSEDPRASLLVATGNLTAKEKQEYYKNGKLDKAKLDNIWDKGGKQAVLTIYNNNPKAFLDKFDAERKRSYDNTNGADVKGNEWYERVNESRKVADKLLNQKTEAKYTSTQEEKIKKNMEANPDYSRDEIIKALGY